MFTPKGFDNEGYLIRRIGRGRTGVNKVAGFGSFLFMWFFSSFFDQEFISFWQDISVEREYLVSSLLIFRYMVLCDKRSNRRCSIAHGEVNYWGLVFERVLLHQSKILWTNGDVFRDIKNQIHNSWMITSHKRWKGHSKRRINYINQVKQTQVQL